MQIAQTIGGYTLGAADLLRRAMGKKLPEEMAKHRFVFIDGAERNGLSKARATQLFDLMEKFAGYGFNKSHAAGYALIAYQTAYFKAHHPAAFIAANLSLVMDDTDKVRHFHDEGVALGLAVVPPDASASSPPRHRREAHPLRAGAIKGTGRSAIEAVVAAREAGGPFADIFDFCARVDRRQVNCGRSRLWSAPAHSTRSTLAGQACSPSASRSSMEGTAQAGAGVALREDSGEAHAGRPTLIDAAEWTENERLGQKSEPRFLSLRHPYHARRRASRLVQQPQASSDRADGHAGRRWSRRCAS
jgi:DNA polymerase-3 subunit alpha